MTPSAQMTIREALLQNRVRIQHKLGQLGPDDTASRVLVREGHQAELSNIAAALDELRQEERRSAAVHAVIDDAIGWPGRGVPQSLTCSEAAHIAEMLAAYGRSVSASVFLDAHAEGDDEGDAHYARYLEHHAKYLARKAGSSAD